jgi:hypothetical protein
VLKLDKAIVKAPYTYKDLIPGRIEIDITAQQITILYGCATVTPQEVTSGTVDKTDPQAPPHFRRAPLVWSFTMEQKDLTAPDPGVTQFFEDLLALVEQVDPVVVAQQHDPGGIATAPWPDGEEAHPLDCTFEAIGDRALTVRVKGPPEVTPFDEERKESSNVSRRPPQR